MLNELHILKIMKDENRSLEEATEKKKEIIDLDQFF